MKNNSGFAPIVVIFVVMLVAGIGGVLTYTYYSQSQSEVSLETSIESEQQQPTQSQQINKESLDDYSKALLTLADVGSGFWIHKEEPRITDEALIHEHGFLNLEREDLPALINQIITVPYTINKAETLLTERIETATHGDSYYLESKEEMGDIDIYRIKNNSAAGKFITYTAFTDGYAVFEIMIADINKYQDELLIGLILAVQGKYLIP